MQPASFSSSLALRSGLVLLAALVALAGCRNGASEAGVADAISPTRRLRLVCTTGQVADLVHQIAGPRVEVEALMGPGVDPHLYRPTPSDLRKLNRADAIFYNGLHLEGRLSEVLESLARKKPTYAVADPLLHHSPELLRTTSEFVGNYDPHIWFDASLWGLCAQYVRDRLVELSPEEADTFHDNAETYIAQLLELHEHCLETVETLPPQSRVLVTAHDAFGYFGRAYGLEVHGIQGLSTLDEADLRNINQLIDLLVDRRVKAVFVESSVPRKNIQSLQQGCSARGHQLAIGGELYSDALGPGGTVEGTYLGMMRYNLNTIVEALR